MAIFSFVSFRKWEISLDDFNRRTKKRMMSWNERENVDPIIFPPSHNSTLNLFVCHKTKSFFQAVFQVQIFKLNFSVREMKEEILFHYSKSFSQEIWRFDSEGLIFSSTRWNFKFRAIVEQQRRGRKREKEREREKDHAYTSVCRRNAIFGDLWQYRDAFRERGRRIVCNHADDWSLRARA